MPLSLNTDTPFSWHAILQRPWPHVQRRLCRAFERLRYARLLSAPTLPLWHKNRIRSCGGTGAAGFLTALPTGPALSIPNDAFRFLARRRLGLPLPSRLLTDSRNDPYGQR